MNGSPRTGAAQITTHWPLLVMIAAVFGTGWTVSYAVRAEIREHVAPLAAKVESLGRAAGDQAVDMASIKATLYTSKDHEKHLKDEFHVLRDEVRSHQIHGKHVRKE